MNTLSEEIDAMVDRRLKALNNTEDVIALLLRCKSALERNERDAIPCEPTEAMMIAGDEAIQGGLMKASIGAPYGLDQDHACRNVYKAMVKAARAGGEGK